MSHTELAQAYGEAWNAHDLDRIMALHADDTTYCLHGHGERVFGRSAVADSFAAQLAAMPDITFESRRLLAGPDFFSHEMTMTATVPDGSEERRISCFLVDVITVADGLVVAKDSYSGAMVEVPAVPG